MNALILVDIQNDFLPGGALAVAEGDRIVPVVNRLQERFDMVVATQDWHPANHGSFAANQPGHRPGDAIALAGLPQILWPTHCVQGTAGANFAPGLEREGWDRVFQKGTAPEIDSYSGFFDNGHRQATGLGEYLRSKNVTDVYVAGLATDYCVKFTVLDALQMGFRTHLITDGCRGVDLQPGDVEKAVAEMRAAGAVVVSSEQIDADSAGSCRQARNDLNEPIKFYRVGDTYGAFSNFSPHPFSAKGKTWRTVEHYFQAQKFAGTPHEEEIRGIASPMVAARMGRSRQRPLRSDWEQVKDVVMREALAAKFEQHADLRELLLGTGERRLVEHTENDRYWADGGDGSGQNRLGELLMELRTRLRVGGPSVQPST